MDDTDDAGGGFYHAHCGDWPPDEGAIDGKCDSCGQTRPVKRCVDPFIDEIRPDDDNPKGNWCYPCWKERKDDV